jgi:dethiobiotin synthetase
MIRFVTGTDTGVGKTVASAVLAHQAASEGKRVRYVKPVQTGMAVGGRGDADFVAAAAGVEADEILRFDEPLAPAVAAERAGKTIDFDGLTAEVLKRETGNDLLIVEGAGGLLAPLAGNRPMADLVAALRAELVVVARPGLGTLNHSALTVEVAAAHGLPVAGVVVCGWPTKPGVAERTNIGRLETLAPIVAVVKQIRGLSVDEMRVDGLKRAFEKGTAIVPKDRW